MDEEKILLIIDAIEKNGSMDCSNFEGTIYANRRKAAPINKTLRERGYAWRVRNRGNVLEKYTPGKLSEDEKKNFSEKIIDYLSKNGLFDDTIIYTGTERYSKEAKTASAERRVTKNGKTYMTIPYDGCPCEYNNPDTITMVYEGTLYYAINHSKAKHGAYDCLNEIAAEYDLYIEQGHAWSLTFYALEDAAPAKKEGSA